MGKRGEMSGGNEGERGREEGAAAMVEEALLSEAKNVREIVVRRIMNADID